MLRISIGQVTLTSSLHILVYLLWAMAWSSCYQAEVVQLSLWCAMTDQDGPRTSLEQFMPNRSLRTILGHVMYLVHPDQVWH
jgi:hypothetical protein